LSPVAEALLNGARVLCSDIPILRDMAAGQASYFSLQGDAVANLAAAMAAALDRPAETKPSMDGSPMKQCLRLISNSTPACADRPDFAAAHRQSPEE